jgi:hypothetical protein
MYTLLSRIFYKGFAFTKRFLWSIPQLIVVLMLVLCLSSCGDKAKSQEPSINISVRQNPQLTNQISEVSPPSVIQELDRSLNYRPSVKILAPKNNETLQDDTVSVRFEVKDLPIFQDSELKLGLHLHVILDNRPYIAVYDAKEPLILENLPAGTHTLRVFASRPWNESFKNEDAYAQVTFNVFTKSDDNNPDSQPLLTYSSPQGDFGAEPILLDFYLTNAPLQIGGKDILKNEIGDWRIRCTINDESFILDRWESIYLKGFKQGKNWVKLEFLDGQGQLVKNVFNSTIRSITYEPKGEDTLDKIVRGELSADQVRRIVDPNYVATPKPVAEPTPETQLQEEKPVIPETIPETIPEIAPQPTPDVTQPEESKPALKQPEKPKKEGFFKLPRIKAPAATIEPNKSDPLPEIVTPANPDNPEKIEIPLPQPEITPTPEATDIPVTEVPQPKKFKFNKYFQRPPATVPEPQVSPVPEIQPEPASNFDEFQDRLPAPSPSLSPTPEATREPEKEAETPAETTLPQKIAPNPEQPEIKRFFNPNQFPNTPSFPSLPLKQPEVSKSPAPMEVKPDELQESLQSQEELKKVEEVEKNPEVKQ